MTFDTIPESVDIIRGSDGGVNSQPNYLSDTDIPSQDSRFFSSRTSSVEIDAVVARQKTLPRSKSAGAGDMIEQLDAVFNMPVTVWQGSILWKIPYNGRGIAEKRFVRIKRAPLNGDHAMPVRIISRSNRSTSQRYTDYGHIVFPPAIVWSNPEKADDSQNAREVRLDGAVQITEGYESRAFLKGLKKSQFLICIAFDKPLLILILNR